MPPKIRGHFYKRISAVNAGFIPEMKIREITHTCLILIFCFLGISPALTHAASTQAVFAKSKGAVVQIRVLDIASGAQQSLGTGFHIGNGLYITNYHVIADLLDKDQHLQTLAQTFDKQEFELELVTLDVVHDLAVMHAKRANLPVITLASKEPERGERLYSLGNPMDIGFTIVEGNYNGYVKGDPRKNIHFTGSLNPGMSGGPTITESGTVAGINVATSGDEVSYLVPAEYAKAMLKRLPAKPEPEKNIKTFRKLVRDQLLVEQNRITNEFLSRPLKVTRLGSFNVPDSNVEWITCWGNSRNTDRDLLKASQRRCTAGSAIYLDEDIQINSVGYLHSFLDGKKLHPLQFLHQYGDAYINFPDTDDNSGRINPAVCQQDFFRKDNIVFRGATCIRLYRDYPGLYNITFRAATQGSMQTGLITTLSMQGFSMNNAKKMITRYVSSFQGAAK